MVEGATLVSVRGAAISVAASAVNALGAAISVAASAVKVRGAVGVAGDKGVGAQNVSDIIKPSYVMRTV